MKNNNLRLRKSLEISYEAKWTTRSLGAPSVCQNWPVVCFSKVLRTFPLVLKS